MKYRVILQDDALQAIERQARYIAEEKQAPQNAYAWLERILQAVTSLQQFPHRCPTAPEDKHRDYEIRMLVVQGYILLFNIDEAAKAVNVIGFRHGRQMPLTEELPGE